MATTKIVKVSLLGLGYNSTSAMVTVKETTEKNHIFSFINGLPTLECVEVKLDNVEDSERTGQWAKEAAFSKVLSKFLGDSGNKPIQFKDL